MRDSEVEDNEIAELTEQEMCYSCLGVNDPGVNFCRHCQTRLTMPTKIDTGIVHTETRIAHLLFSQFSNLIILHFGISHISFFPQSLDTFTR